MANEKTKTLKVKQIAAAGDSADAELYAVVEDGSVWQYISDENGGEWSELPAIEVVDEIEGD